MTADTICLVSGSFNGQIVINGGDDYKFELEMCGLTLYSSEQNPIMILSGDKVTLTAKKETKTMPCRLSALAVYLGSNNASFSAE